MRDDDKTREQLLEELQALRARPHEAAASPAWPGPAPFLASLLDHSPAPIHAASADEHYLLVNRAWEAFFNRRREDVLGRPLREVVPEETGRQFAAINRRVLETGVPATVEEFAEGARGRRTFHTVKFPLRDAGGQVTAVGGISIDITELKAAEESRHRSEAQLAEAQQMAHLGSWEWDLASDSVTWSDQLFRTYGLAPQASGVTFQAFLDRVHPEDRERVRTAVVQAARDGQSFEHDHRIVLPDGGVRILHARGRVVPDRDGSPARMVGTCQDVTEARQAEESLQLQARVLENMVEGVNLSDENGILLYTNPAEDALFGYARGELLGRSVTVFRDAPAEEAARRVGEVIARLRATGEWSGEIRSRRKDGTSFLAAVRLTRLELAGKTCWLAVKQDITERRRLEEELRQAQKMEAVGRLAGGVAHDFNNTMTVVTGYSDLLLASLGPDHPLAEQVLQIQRAATRATAVTAQLLAFGRRSLVTPRTLDLNAFLQEMMAMLGQVLRADIHRELALGAGPAWVRVDPGQLHQVVLNLALNARDAMPQGGRLTLETERAEVGAESRGNAEARPGRTVRLTVRDTGCGMSADVQAHAFEPFYTTKGLGQGTGLGLSAVHGIVQQASGTIEVETRQGFGSAFHVFLPEATPGETTAVVPLTEWPRGSEVVLLVEDEEALRCLAAHVLRRCGYAVLEAADGVEALQGVERHAGPLHLLVTDVVMPRMGGRELAECLGRQRPGLRVLYLSGYTEDVILRQGAEVEVPFLQKPFKPDVLAHKVREVLDR